MAFYLCKVHIVTKRVFAVLFFVDEIAITLDLAKAGEFDRKLFLTPFKMTEGNSFYLR
jgi:hypothetical protein